MATERKPLYLTLDSTKQFELSTTASAVGIDLNTGKQIYYNTSSLDWATQETITASYGVFSQDITASNLYLTGNIAVSGNLVFGEYGEKITLETGIDGGTTNFDYSTATIFYVSGATSDGTWNITNVPTTDKIASKIKFVIDQNTVPHSASAYQFNGNSITIKWQNGSIPAGTANHTDVIELNAYHSGSGWNILGSIQTFA